ncbi:MAG: hypothetical protein Q9198_003239 [Flavoplaca austrocitrina]
MIPIKLSKPKLYTLHLPNGERRRAESKVPKALSKCLQKGQRESPTYDKLGYELDYEYIVKHTGRPRPVSKRGQEGLEQKQKGSETKAEIMGRPAPELEENAWVDRVAIDLGKAFHEMGMEEYEEGARRDLKSK